MSDRPLPARAGAEAGEPLVAGAVTMRIAGSSR
jgi:hypothetical protein